MKKSILILSIIAFSAVTSSAFAQSCPSGQSFDQNAKKCVSNKRGS